MGRYPWAEVFIFQILRVVVFYPTRHNLYRVVVLAATIYLAAQIYLTPEVTDPIIVTYLVGVTTALHLTSALYLLCTEGPFPDHWRRVRDGVLAEPGAGGLDKSPSNFPFKKKVWWMLDVAHSPRMIGWVQEPRDCLPPPPPPSRRTFLQETSLKFMVNVVTIDLSASAASRSPTFDSRPPHVSTHSLKSVLAAAPLLRHVPYVLAFGVMTAACLNAAHNVAALIFVGIGHSSPTLWPDVWGHWGDAYTVRKLWGRTWHQLMRPMLAGLGRFISHKFLKFPRGTNRSSYAQLYVAFFLSGTIHFAGDFMSQRRMVYHSFKFFLLQAVAITFEDLVIYIGKRLLLRRVIKLNPDRADGSWAEAAARTAGYCWVTLWFCLTLPAWRDKTTAIGWDGADRLPISQLVLGAWKQWA